jgi:hypothetical protein
MARLPAYFTHCPVKLKKTAHRVYPTAHDPPLAHPM